MCVPHHFPISMPSMRWVRKDDERNTWDAGNSITCNFMFYIESDWIEIYEQWESLRLTQNMLPKASSFWKCKNYFILCVVMFVCMLEKHPEIALSCLLEQNSYRLLWFGKRMLIQKQTSLKMNIIIYGEVYTNKNIWIAYE